MTPPATHSPTNHAGDETFIATRLGKVKIPAPMTIPTTIEAAEATDKQRRGCGWPCAGGEVVIGRKARGARVSYARGGFLRRGELMGISRPRGSEVPTPSSRYSGTPGRRQGRGATGAPRRLPAIRRSTPGLRIERYNDSTRTSPLSPALSPQTDAGRGRQSLGILNRAGAIPPG